MHLQPALLHDFVCLLVLCVNINIIYSVPFVLSAFVVFLTPCSPITHWVTNESYKCVLFASKVWGGRDINERRLRLRPVDLPLVRMEDMNIVLMLQKVLSLLCAQSVLLYLNLDPVLQHTGVCTIHPSCILHSRVNILAKCSKTQVLLYVFPRLPLWFFFL